MAIFCIVLFCNLQNNCYSAEYWVSANSRNLGFGCSLLKVLDLDGDGQLSKAELRVAIERVVGLSTFEGQDALLNMVMEAGGDKDKDGNITIDELNA